MRVLGYIWPSLKRPIRTVFRKLLWLPLIAVLFTSCDQYLNRQIMLRTGPDYPYAQFDGTEQQDIYRIAPNDLVEVRLYSNNGFQMVNLATLSGTIAGGGTQLTLQVEHDGFAKLPLIGRAYLQGLTARQAEMLLEDKYREFYNEPFVLIKVVNRRVMLFLGSNSQVIQLENEKTTLFEALAKAGGLSDDAIASNIKLIRGDINSPQVFQIDLSNLKGLKNADIVLQANDIIYVETKKRSVARISEAIAPWLALLTSAILVWSLTTRFTQ